MKMKLKVSIQLATLGILFLGVVNVKAPWRSWPVYTDDGSAAREAAQEIKYEELLAEQKRQQAIFAAQRQANLEAAEKAEWDEAVAWINHQRDEALAKLNAEYDPIISDLLSKIAALKQKATQLEDKRSQSEQENAHLRAKQLFQPKDPWRMLDGKIYNAKDTQWFLFTGTVLEIKQGGILLHGSFGPPLEANFGECDYFVDNFPNQIYSMVDGETITFPMNLVAHFGGRSTYQYTNTTIDLRVHTVRRLDYGEIVDSPPPDLVKKWSNQIIIASDDNPQLTDEINDAKRQQSLVEFKLSQVKDEYSQKSASINAEDEAKITDLPNVFAKRLKDKQDKEKQAIAAKALAFNQSQADKGDPVGLLRMGERYRDGDGVSKNLDKAREYFNKASAAGSPTATDELSKLNQSSPDSTDLLTNSIPH
jgi:hypothetical protein